MTPALKLPAAPRERPVLFSAPMILALLAEKKTQTRRVVKAEIPADADEVFAWYEPEMEARGVKLAEQGLHARKTGRDGWLRHLGACPYGKPGDRLWVRETCIIAPKNFTSDSETRSGIHRIDPECKPRLVQCLATCPDRHGVEQWGLRVTPSIHMPRWASRLSLDVTGVRVERLQEITEEDAKAEGVQIGADGYWCGKPHAIKGTPRAFNTAREAFIDLWDSIYGERKGCSWDANPWVWVVEFRRVEVAT